MSDQLVEAPRSRTGLYVVVGVVVLAVVAAVAFFALRGGDDEDTVVIGVVDASEPYWDTYVDAAADEGITVELKNFADYTQPNPALSEGDLDLNQFQHIVYLAGYNVDADEDLVPIGATAIYPLALYSTQFDSVEDIPDGSTVAVPNDDSNLARGLLVLQSAGLITLEGGGSIYSTLDEIDEEASRVKVTALDANLTPTSLPDVAAAIINNDFVEDAGLTFEDAIAQDDPEDPNALPYVNIFAARAEDQDNETYRKLVEIYQTNEKVQAGVQEASGNTAVLLKTPVADLEESLAQVEEDTRAQQ
ncbi:MetQ/NlpA family ABC transporter substrate-binding protein [Nocardioides lianchengensis]|uniref:D-methionine transport system substrate-binding protein n=1 Tax=Nocardioides lianchengensis TaxID=1045774 RepID=A0A1G6TVP4_9ACTN|nr:MetQ/NlpA family ABC transporter substrate-binding protein [Nocardioides lianchengensis]NYG11628.1 D-methionine transport system substrate-binding protein [Nocardioides lianchengensis]SDD32974.1 D-methionine transport system substrate-binding protein [Nocardioides lianchengensis]